MMKHKIAYLCILALLAGLLVLAGTGVLQSASPPKATGGIGFTRNNNQGDQIQCWAEFEAKATSDTSAKGWLKYHDVEGLRFRVDVQCLTVVGDHDAIFSGPIVSASDTTLVGQWLLIAVHDGGTPGSKGDTIWGEFYLDNPGCDSFPPGRPSDVESGNLVVH
jgi:hypothetical protein